MEIKRYGKGTFGWFKEQAEKDGFDNIRNWQNWKREQINKIKKREFEQSWTKEKVLDLIRETYNNIGRIPARSEFCDNPKHPGIHMIRRLFGCWNDAIYEAGLWDKKDFSRYTKNY